MAKFKDEMICDLAEVYGIYDYKGLSVSMLTALVFGLGDSSRVKKALTGNKVGLETYLLGYIADSLAFIAWAQTDDAKKGRNKPKRIIDLWSAKEEKTDYIGYESAEAFESARANILKGAIDG